MTHTKIRIFKTSKSKRQTSVRDLVPPFRGVAAATSCDIKVLTIEVEQHGRHTDEHNDEYH